MPSDDPVDKPALLHREESTTPDLVERVRDLWAYGAHGDWGSILRLYAPRAVWDMSPVGLGTYEDLAALRGRWQDWIDAYEELEVDVEEVLDLGHGVVLALIAQKGRPLGSSRHVQERLAVVYVWAAGLVVRVTNYTDVDEARAAAERLAESRG